MLENLKLRRMQDGCQTRKSDFEVLGRMQLISSMVRIALVWTRHPTFYSRRFATRDGAGCASQCQLMAAPSGCLVGHCKQPEELRGRELNKRRRSNVEQAERSGFRIECVGTKVRPNSRVQASNETE